ncbi:PAS domain S-box protein [uncultured Methanoregula sp.]|uniref:PAS domain S-box protein n=1 Tax=uncultured Methanoregula sp. TaxID=1005933 RepID=UPI002AAAD928|nr:PAS domain S-box protein [uncultured Methanoregula sp.]
MYSVLYVDDETDLLEVGKLYLEDDPDLHVDTASSAPKALEKIRVTHYDVIVSDYLMPRMNGIDFLKEVRSRFGDIPFILFTGRGREEVVIGAINNGADFYLQKGGDPDAQFAELSHKIKRSAEQKKDKDAMNESKQRLSNIINFLPDATFAIDNNGIVIAWNKAIEEMTGIASSEILGKGDHEYAIPFYGICRPLLIDLILRPQEEIEKNYQIISREKGVLIAETSLPSPGGKPAFLLGKASLLYNREGMVTGAIESIRDITETKQREKALRESEELHRSLFLASPDGIAVADTSGIMTHVSPRALELFGVESAAEVIGTNVLDWISDEERQQAGRDLAALIARGGISLGKEYHTLKKDGSIFPVAISTAPMKDRDGRVIGIVTIVRDITRRKTSEKALLESEEKFRTLIEQSLDGIIIADVSGLLLFANPRVGEIIESGQYRSLVGQANVFDLLTPEFREKARNDFLQIQTGSDTFFGNYRITTFSHKEIWIECTGRKISFEEKSAVLLSLRDITSRKLIEAALRKANEKLNILSSITRHDIVNELLAQDAYSTFLAKKIGDNPEALHLLGKIRNASRKIGDQIRFTKDYQDMGANDPVWQNIATIAKIAACDNLPDGITLAVDTGDYEVFADPMLMLAFYNLFENTMRHGENASRITLSFTVSGTRGTLVIEDNGVGVPDDIRDSIFEKGVGKNTGFGLFLTGEILAITGLEIHETGSFGKGARFEISIPPGMWRRGR